LASGKIDQIRSESRDNDPKTTPSHANKLRGPYSAGSFARGSNVELLVLNRFGKAEAEGGGLRSAFVRAIEAGIPVVTAVRSPYIAAWSEFHERLAVDLTPDLGAVLAWCRDAVRELRAARRTVLSPTG
jgi:hypothetical protein